MNPHRRRPRRGYTVLELLVVMAILILFATLVLPSLAGFFGGNRPKAAADQIRGELAAARAWAIEEGVPYRVAVSADGTKIRRAPEAEFDQPAMENAPASARRAEQTFEKVVAEVLTDDGSAPQAGSGGWVTVAVVMPDGTCRDDREESDENGNQVVIVAVREQLEPGKPSAGAIHVTIRGITGQVQVAPAGKTQGQP